MNNEDRPLGGSGAYNFEQTLNEYDEFEAQEWAEADQTQVAQMMNHYQGILAEEIELHSNQSLE